MSHLRLQSKARIAIVLCLSSICVILSIARLAAGMHRNVFEKWQYGMAWLSFMLHCEASVAVVAGSIPALRAFYTAHQNSKMAMANEKAPENTKGKALQVLGSMGWKTQPTLPKYERVQPRASIARWRQSIVGIIPRKPTTYVGGSLNVVDLDGHRMSAAESVMLHPTLAYHNIRKEELQRDGMRRNRETVVWSEAARSKYASLDMREVSSKDTYKPMP